MRHRRAKKKKLVERLLAAGIALITVIICFIAVSSNFYKTHYSRNTELYGVDISKKTVKSVLDSFNNDDIYYLKIGSNEIPLKSVVTLDKKGLTDYLSTGKFTASVNREKLKSTIEGFNLNSEATKSEDAKIKKDQEGNFTIKDEVNGNEINIDKLTNEVQEDLEENSLSNYKMKNFYIKPKLTSESTEIKDKLAKLNLEQTAKITFKVKDKEYEVNEDIIKKAISVNGINVDGIKDYVSSVDESVRTKNANYDFTTHNGKKLTMWNSTSYGWEINVNSTVDKIKAAISNYDGTPVSLNADIEGDNIDETSPFNGNYAEVDLDEQKAYIFKDGKEVFKWDVITGLPNENNMTNVGYHEVLYKQSPSVLRGTNNDGTPYASPVNYWVPFNWEGEGFHDADWQTSGFGGDKYKYLGSHGCVNTSPADMKKAWELTYTGMPVIVWGSIYDGL